MTTQATVDNILLPPTNNLMAALARSHKIIDMKYWGFIHYFYSKTICQIKPTKVKILLCEIIFCNIFLWTFSV